MEFSDTTPFAGPFSTIDNPRLEFVMEVRLTFPEVYTLANVPSGGNRSAVLVSGGTFEGPLLKGRAVPGSGGDYAYFRPDDVAVFDARYLRGRQPDTMTRLRDWAFKGGAPVGHEEYYLRGNPTFEVPTGKHDWLTKHVFIGVGERRSDCNLLRYYALV